MHNWEKIKLVDEIQNFINNNIQQKISLSEISKAVNYSQWHCSRVFKEVAGKCIFDYIRELRLTEAAKIIAKGNCKIVDVAFDFVFDSHEGFTRAFTKKFGISPNQYRKEPKAVNYFIPFRVKDYYLHLQKGEVNMDKKVATVFTQVIERPKRKLICKRGIKATHYFEYCEEVGCDVWGILVSLKNTAFEPAGFWLPNHLVKPNTSVYVQGVEVHFNYNGEIPKGFDVIELPPCKMMVFQGQPYNDDHFEDAISEVWEAISAFDPKLYGYQWNDEIGPRFQLEPQGYRGYIEARPISDLEV